MTRYKINYDNIIKKNKKYNTTYGELTSEGLDSLFQNINIDDKTFYDLGSGKGSVIINAINNYPGLKKGVGIEYVEDRHNIAVKKSMLLDNNKKNKIEFIHGDFTSDSINLSDADLIYISNLCLSEETNKEIANKINREVKNGTVIFSSKQIPLKNVKDCKTTNVNQTWKKGSNIYINKI